MNEFRFRRQCQLKKNGNQFQGQEFPTALPNFLILVIEQMPVFPSSEHTQYVTFTWQSYDHFNFTYPIIFEKWK